VLVTGVVIDAAVPIIAGISALREVGSAVGTGSPVAERREAILMTMEPLLWIFFGGQSDGQPGQAHERHPAAGDRSLYKTRSHGSLLGNQRAEAGAAAGVAVIRCGVP
jgi:hypothetical protein